MAKPREHFTFSAHSRHRMKRNNNAPRRVLTNWWPRDGDTGNSEKCISKNGQPNPHRPTDREKRLLSTSGRGGGKEVREVAKRSTTHLITSLSVIIFKHAVLPSFPHVTTRCRFARIAEISIRLSAVFCSPITRCPR